jgi:hypothetical protein
MNTINEDALCCLRFEDLGECYKIPCHIVLKLIENVNKLVQCMLIIMIALSIF